MIFSHPQSLRNASVVIGIGLLIVVLLLPTRIFTAEPVEKIRMAEELIELLETQSAVEAQLTEVKTALRISTQSSLSSVDVNDELREIINEYLLSLDQAYDKVFSWKAQKQVYMTSYLTLLSESELANIVYFLKSPAGESFMEAQKETNHVAGTSIDQGMASLSEEFQSISDDFKAKLEITMQPSNSGTQ